MAIVPPEIDPHTMALVRMAVREDMGHASYGTVQGDKTVELSIPAELSGRARIVARKPGVIAGTYLLPIILREYQVGMGCDVIVPDGSAVEGPQSVVAELSGGIRALLSAERVCLNFLGHLSGVASLTRQYVDAVAGSGAVICDTRKTTPGYRVLDKYAVRCGGGVNHRMGLHDGVMLKDNHLAALRDQLGRGKSLAELTSAVRAKLDAKVPLWLEVDTLAQLAEELSGGGADVILLDNMEPPQMRQAVAMRDAAGSKAKLEASGGITLDNVRAVAATGVERISIGALTHSAMVLDLAMEL